VRVAPVATRANPTDLKNPQGWTDKTCDGEAGSTACFASLLSAAPSIPGDRALCASPVGRTMAAFRRAARNRARSFDLTCHARRRLPAA